MSAVKGTIPIADELSPKLVRTIPEKPIAQRVASIDWMRGLAMVLMIIDHASIAFDSHHLDHDSAMYPDASTMALPGADFFPHWLAHLCAASFVFLMGASLALSVERRVVKGVNAREIDKGMPL
jgi:uncharacterized membrane protein